MKNPNKYEAKLLKLMKRLKEDGKNVSLFTVGQIRSRLCDSLGLSEKEVASMLDRMPDDIDKIGPLYRASVKLPKETK